MSKFSIKKILLVLFMVVGIVSVYQLRKGTESTATASEIIESMPETYFINDSSASLSEDEAISLFEFTKAQSQEVQCMVYSQALRSDKLPKRNYTAFFTIDKTNLHDEQTVPAGSKLVRPIDPIKAGYKFIGWYATDPCSLAERLWDFDVDYVKFDVILFAKFEKETYQVAFDANGGAPTPDTQTVEYEGLVQKPVEPKKDKNEFLGWFVKEDVNRENEWNFDVDRVDSDITLVAKWRDVTDPAFVVTFNANGGTPTPAEQRVNANAKVVEPPAPTKVNDVFLGWYYNEDGNKVFWDFANDVVTKDMTLIASWQNGDPGEFRVVFNPDGGTPTPDEQKVKSGNKAQKPVDVAKEDNTFVHWFYLDTATQKEIAWDFDKDVVTKDVYLTAKWKSNATNYTVTFDTDGGNDVPSQILGEGQKAQKPTNPTKSGFTFVKWFYIDNEEKIEWNFNTIVTSDLYLIAEWREGADPGKHYLVEFDPDAGLPKPGNQKVREGQKVDFPAKVVKYGYEFINWFYVDENDVEITWNFDTDVVNNDLYLIARWREDTTVVPPPDFVHVTFDANGGTPTPSGQKIKKGEVVFDPARVVRQGYKFLGWYLEENATEKLWDFKTDLVQRDMTLKAKWEEDKFDWIKVEFDADGGTPTPEAQVVKKGSKVVAPTGVTKHKSELVEWFYVDLDTNTEITWNFDKDKADKDMLLIARWRLTGDPEPTEVLIQFHPDGGLPKPANQIVPKGSKVARPAKVVKNGFEFVNWFYVHNGTEITWDFDVDVANEDMLLIARWRFTVTPPGDFTVRFDPKGGTPTPSNQVVKKGGKVLEPVTVTKVNDEFVAWVYTDNGSEKKWDFAKDTVEANMILTAKWKNDDKKHVVRFDPDGGTPDPESQEVATGGKVTAPVKVEKYGYNFVEWFYVDLDTLEERVWNFDTNTVSKDMLLIARWRDNGTPPIPIEEVLIRFNPDGGLPTPGNQKVKKGLKVARPTEVVKYGYKFVEWFYIDENYAENSWDFDTDVATKDMLLIARWIDDGTQVKPEEFIATFDPDGGVPNPSPQRIKKGNRVLVPTEVIKKDATFINWVDKSNNINWDFATRVDKDIALLAKWKSSDDDNITITFDPDGGTPTPVAQTIKKGEKVARPREVTKPGFDFVEWFYVDLLTLKEKAWNFDTDVATKDMLLIARWEDNGTPPEILVTFDPDGGLPIPSAQKLKKGDKVVEPTEVVKYGFKLVKWFYVDADNKQVTWNFASDVVVRNLTLIASWEYDLVIPDPDVFTVTFDPDGGTPAPSSQRVREGNRALKPVQPTKKSFTFVAWVYDDNGTNKPWDFNTPIVSDLTLTATWRDGGTPPDKVTVTFDSDAGTPTPAVQTLNKGDKVQNPVTVTKYGFKFVHWFYVDLNSRSEVTWNFATDTVEKDLYLIAKWENDGITPPTHHIVTFDANGGEPTPSSQKIEKGKKADMPAQVTKVGYNLTGWEVVGSGKVWNFATDTVNSDMTLKAIWEISGGGDKVTVTFDPDGGEPKPANQQVEKGGKVSTPAQVTKIGYNLVRWEVVGSGKVWNFATDTVNSDMTLKAIWEKGVVGEKVTVTFDPDAGKPTPAVQTLNKGDKVQNPGTVTKYGYKFLYWFYVDLNSRTEVMWNFATDTVEKDLYLIAKWENDGFTPPSHYTVTFDANGGKPTPSSQKVEKGKKADTPTQVIKDGYDLTGWEVVGSGKVWNFATDTVSSDMTLKAIWKETGVPITYVVTFDSKGGAPIPASQTVAPGSKVAKPADPTKTDFDFDKWIYIAADGSEVEWLFADFIVESNLTLIAKYKVKGTKHVITFNANGGQPTPAPQLLNTGDLVEEPTGVRRSNYVLIDWTYNDNGIIRTWDFDEAPVSESFVITARWLRSDCSFSVLYLTKGGLPIPTSHLSNVGTKLVKPANPTKSGYDFKGWEVRRNGKTVMWDFTKDTVLGDVVLIASWEANGQQGSNEYTISFDADGGSPAPQPQKVKAGELVKLPTKPVKADYLLDYWFAIENGKEKIWNFDVDVADKDLNLKAKWCVDEECGIYVAYFDSGEGSPNPGEQILVEGSLITRPSTEPTLEGFIFDGWVHYRNGVEKVWDFDNDMMLTSSMTLKAKWKINQTRKGFVASFNTVVAGIEVKDQSVNGGDLLSKPVAPVREGYNFGYWYTFKDGTFKVWNFETDTIDDNIELYAKWTKKPIS